MMALPSRNQLGAAGRAIRDLEGHGFTQKQIAVAIGRDPSYVSQINRGVTPGDKVAGALGDLAAGRPATPPPSRAGRSVPDTVVRTPRGGMIVNVDSAGAMRRTVANVARRGGHDDGGRLRIVATGIGKDGRPRVGEPWKRGGIRAGEFQREVNKRLPSNPTAEDVALAVSGVIADAAASDQGSDLEGMVIESYSIEVL